MRALMGIAAVLAVGAMTPGPNNLAVMRAASRSGIRGALPSIAGIVLGSLALLLAVSAGAGAAFQADLRLRKALAWGGGLYLGSMGVRLVVRTFSRTPRPLDADQLPSGVVGLVGFQFLNPKSWVLVLTAAAAADASGAMRTFLRLAPLFVVIPAACLAVWSVFGSLLARALERSAVRQWVDRGMGLLLAGSAALLVAEA